MMQKGPWSWITWFGLKEVFKLLGHILFLLIYILNRLDMDQFFDSTWIRGKVLSKLFPLSIDFRSKYIFLLIEKEIGCFSLLSLGRMGWVRLSTHPITLNRACIIGWKWIESHFLRNQLWSFSLIRVAKVKIQNDL